MSWKLLPTKNIKIYGIIVLRIFDKVIISTKNFVTMRVILNILQIHKQSPKSVL